MLTRTGKANAASKAFGDLLVQAGLRPRPTTVSHRSRAIGHSGRRKINALSFHSLRRTATTLLHEAGVPSTVAQALIGHDSEEVHSDYIKIGRDALRNAVNLFPTIQRSSAHQHYVSVGFEAPQKRRLTRCHTWPDVN